MQFIICLVYYILYFLVHCFKAIVKSKWAVSFGSHFYEKYHAGMKQNFMSVSHVSLRTVYAWYQPTWNACWIWNSWWLKFHIDPTVWNLISLSGHVNRLVMKLTKKSNHTLVALCVKQSHLKITKCTKVSIKLYAT